MAILKNFEAAVVVEGTDLPEFIGHNNIPGFQADTNNVKNVYIEATSNKNYHIRCKALEKKFGEKKIAGISLRAIIDGEKCRPRGLLKTDYPYDGQFDAFESVRDGFVYKQELSFNPIKIEQQDNPEQDEEHEEPHIAIGCIQIRVLRVQSTLRKDASTPTEDRAAASNDDQPIYQQTIGARKVTHHTMFGPPIKVRKKGAGWTAQYVDDESHDDPYLIFNFFYLGKDLLQKFCLIPEAVKPESEPAETKLESNSRSTRIKSIAIPQQGDSAIQKQLLELVAQQQRNIDAVIALCKREREDDDDTIAITAQRPTKRRVEIFIDND